MHAQVVQDQENSLLPSMHKPLHGADQDLRVQGSGEDLPTHLALVGRCRNDAQLGTIGVGKHNGRLIFGGIATTAHIIGTKARLVPH